MPHWPVYKKAVQLPEGVQAELDASDPVVYRLTVRGPLGEVTKEFDKLGIIMRVEQNKIVLEKHNATRKHKRVINCYATKIKNMVTGVTKGWRYRLKIIFKHFPIEVRLEGNRLRIDNFMGERVPRYAEILPGVAVEIGEGEIIVKGIDLEAVGQTAANIEQATRPYGKKDRRRFWDGIYIVEKKVVGL
ncbi:MAG: 50S ribosomal protein L6 [bacterium]|nr:50S ribosomal protein L6 [bacterium]